MCPQVNKGEDNINSEFSLSLGKSYMFRVHVMHSTSSKLPFSRKHVKWKLRLNDN